VAFPVVFPALHVALVAVTTARGGGARPINEAVERL
jgi:hypothetical protein